MRHVLVETNWVVAVVAPGHLQAPEAVELRQKARDGQLRLHLPAISLTEARHPVLTKYQPRPAADILRKYLHWAAAARRIENERADLIRVVLDQYEASVLSELDEMDRRLQDLTVQPGIEVFALTEEMLTRAVELSLLRLELKPFDQAILAAVLVRAEQLRHDGADEVAFCELDSDLQPWDRTGASKQPLSRLYDAARLWVYGDFALRSPARPESFGK